MNITPSVNQSLGEQAQEAADITGTSSTQAVRDDVKQQAEQQVPAELEAFEVSALQSPGQLRGWCFNREEANQRR